MRQSPTQLAAGARRRELYSLLGKLPARDRPIIARKRDEGELDGYILQTWDLDLNGIETVPAHVARPRTITGRVPAVLLNHSHGGGRAEDEASATRLRPLNDSSQGARISLQSIHET